MKTELTIEQGSFLENRGIKSASKWVEAKDAVGSYKAPIFTLADILELLPKEIKRNGYGSYTLNIVADNHYWDVEYRYWRGDDDTLALFESTELIDALYELLLWVIDNKYLKV